MIVQSILIFRSGLLGDTLAAVPALWCLREAYPGAKITYVWQHLRSENRVKAEDVLKDSGLVDQFECYDAQVFTWRRGLSKALLFFRLKKTNWDIAIVLEEPHWVSTRTLLAKWCGPKLLVTPLGAGERLPREGNGRLKRWPPIADVLMEVLRPLNINIPPRGHGRSDLNLRGEDHSRVGAWLDQNGALESPHPWIGIGPWSNMPVKRWPVDRYREVVDRLIKEYNVTPFILGGRDERGLGKKLVEQWGRGFVACGELSIREGIGLLSRCVLYLGNDTGVMHMAASAGIPCVAVFCSHEAPGRWEPYGKGHKVFRTPIECEGCLLSECVELEMKCIRSIQVDEVVEACHMIFEDSRAELRTRSTDL